jgi:hypothetical protein
MASWAARPAASPAGLRPKPRGTQWHARYCRRLATTAPGSDGDGSHIDGSVELIDTVAPALRRLHWVLGLAADMGNSNKQASGEVGVGGGSWMTSSGGTVKSSGI